MNIDDRMIRHLKKTSIRARFAIGLTCIKKYFRNEGLQGDPSVRLIIEKYAGFTCSQKFDVWENEMEHYNTGINRVFSSGEEIRASLQKTNKVYAAYNHPGNSSAWYDGIQLPVYDEQTYDNLLCFYSILDEDILKDLKTCEQIATSGFYGSIIRHSEDSLIPTLEILKKTDADFDSEAIARRYPFEEGGWGSAFRFNDFMKS